jgi:hypothetical protein
METSDIQSAEHPRFDIPRSVMRSLTVQVDAFPNVAGEPRAG